MNYWKKYCFSCLIFLLGSTCIFAQNTEDVIHLENGSVIRGKIIAYEKEGTIKIEILGGSVLVYKSEEVVKMTKEETLEYNIPKKKRPLHKFSKGLYNSITIGTLMGADEWGNAIPGMSLDYVGGWHFHRLIGIGGGLGVSMLGDNPFIPIYANIRGHFMKSSASLFYDINVGYGIALVNNMRIFEGGWEQMESAKGGLYVRPSIGIRFPSTKRTHLVMDFGYMIQFAEYHYRDWNNNPVDEKRIFYRPSLRIGLVF